MLSRRQFLFAASGACTLPALLSSCRTASDRSPNFIIVFTDDQGYNDLGVYGSADIKTPRIDRMAREGLRFTDFYATPICSPSRAALLTGSYAVRAGMPDVHIYGAPFGLSPAEVTIADVLKTEGYATACFGKWHLGQEDMFAPGRQGFDLFYGTRMVTGTQPFENFAVPLYYNDRKLTDRPDFFRFTQDYSRAAVSFIESNRQRPFFIYLAHPMPHIPIYPGKEFENTSDAGLFGDAIEEIDWCTGLILDALAEQGLDEMTLVIYTSDNGPWLGFGDQSGSAAPLRGAKLTTWEGGVRVPCVMRWPTKIPAGSVTGKVASVMDFLPTLAHLAGASLPADHTIDGKNLWPLMRGDADAESPHDVLYFYAGTWLQAVRAGRWKLHLARPEAKDGIYGECEAWFTRNTTLMQKPQLFDLQEDIGEERDVAAHHPDVVERLLALAETARQDLGDYGIRGPGVRPTGFSHPDYPDPKEWLGSPHWSEVTAAMQEDLRSWRQYRFQLLKRQTSMHARERLELEWYEEHADLLL